MKTEETIAEVEELICSQEDNPGSHQTPNEIALYIGCSRSSVRRMVVEDLDLQPLKKIKGQKLSDTDCTKRVQRCQQLLRAFSKKSLENSFSVTRRFNNY